MNAFIVELRNQPGELARVTESIAQKGIDIRAFSAVTCGGSGSLALVTNDEAATRTALADAGYAAREIEVVGAPTSATDHRPGTLAAAARKLADAGINVEAAMPIEMDHGTVIAFATDQPTKALAILG